MGPSPKLKIFALSFRLILARANLGLKVRNRIQFGSNELFELNFYSIVDLWGTI